MARIHRRKSDLKASVRSAHLRAAGDILLMLCAAALGIWALSSAPDWLVGIRAGGIGGQWLALLASLAAAAVLLVRFRINRKNARVRQAGVAGETEALRQLKSLPAGYHLFNDLKVSWGGHVSELDLVAVGPGGVSVVEVKNYSGQLTGDAGGRNLTHQHHGREESVYNPMRQVETHASRLQSALAASGHRTTVRSYVYFVNPRLSVALTGSSRTKYFTGQTLPELLEDIRSSRAQLSHKQAESIAELLEKL